MSNISGTDTKPEILLRKALFANGFRYRKNVKRLPGKPDIVLPKYRSVIFVHGCFWHGHSNCKKATMPKTNSEFWNDKIYRNKVRDIQAIQKLQCLGWNVIVIWQCQLSNMKIFNQTLNKLIEEIVNNKK